MATYNQPPQLLSLQELCVKQLLEQILHSNAAYQEFSSLPPRAQRLLFDTLKANELRLRDVDKNWSLLTRSCPRIDTQIYLNSTDWRNEFLKSQYILDWHYNEDSVDEYEIWAQQSRDAAARGTSHDSAILTQWRSRQLFSSSPYSDFQICAHLEHDTEASCPICQPDENATFENRISPQLFLYRLTTTYGMPWRIDRINDSILWTVVLRHHDGISLIAFDDVDGEVEVCYSGTPPTSDSALGLLNYLAGLVHSPQLWPPE